MKIDIDNQYPPNTIITCIKCKDHKIIKDPDPDDWFCDDDVAVVCKRVLNKNQDLTSKWKADQSEYQAITRSCRPHHIEEESKIPDWCPKKHENKKNHSIFAGR